MSDDEADSRWQVRREVSMLIVSSFCADSTFSHIHLISGSACTRRHPNGAVLRHRLFNTLHPRSRRTRTAESTFNPSSSTVVPGAALT